MATGNGTAAEGDEGQHSAEENSKAQNLLDLSTEISKIHVKTRIFNILGRILYIQFFPHLNCIFLNGQLMLNSSLDADLEDYADLCLGLVDIPLHKSRLESLHVLFSLYAEFRASQHFRNLALDRTETERGDTAPSTTIDQFILEEGRH